MAEDCGRGVAAGELVIPRACDELCPNGVEAVEMESFYRAGRFLRSILDLDELLTALLQEALDAVGGTRGFIGIIDRSTAELEIRITVGPGWEQQPSRTIPITGEPGGGITSLVAATGVPYFSGDVPADPHYVMFFPDVRSEIAVPLLNRDGRTNGVINIESEEPNAFSDRDMKLLSSLASQAAIAVSVANYRSREAALIELGNEFASRTDMDELLECVTRRTAELLRAEDCALFQLSRDGGRLILLASSRLLRDRVGELTYRLGEGLTGWVAQHGLPLRLEDARHDPRWLGLYPELPEGAEEAYLAVPIFGNDRLWGVLRVLRRKHATTVIPNSFTIRDEMLLSTLARQVGAAVSRQELVERELQMERMAAWGEMSARSAHMIGNKVFALKGHLNELEHLAWEREPKRDALLEVSRRARESLFRLEEILNEFRDFLRATHLERAPTDLNELLSASLREDFSASESIQVTVEAAPDLPPADADAAKLRRAISELLENAVLHQPSGGAIHVVTGPWGVVEREAYPELPFRAEWAEEGSAVRLEIRDEGPGIAPAVKERLFTPFFTTRSQGMGLGLPIVKGIVDAHRGAIAEVGREGAGAHFLIVLPAHRGE